MAPAQATTASQGVAANETQVATSEVAELTFEHLDENGFTASVANGSVTKQLGGSVVIVDEDGAVAGEFSTATLLEDRTVRNIEYQVDGNEIVALYDSPVVEGVMPVFMQNCTPGWIMMAGAGAAAIGAAATDRSHSVVAWLSERQPRPKLELPWQQIAACKVNCGPLN